MAAAGDGRALDVMKPLDASRPVPREPARPTWASLSRGGESRESRRPALHRVHDVRHAASELV
ncbi:hypothetical protein ACUJ8H_36370, partial [Streptomyces sp. EKR5.2]|uniref:hypothetical protein n=1 Tax=Streptomyces sp. EKR5.2 TaxID=3461014 RepID=UPI004042FB4B